MQGLQLGLQAGISKQFRFACWLRKTARGGPFLTKASLCAGVFEERKRKCFRLQEALQGPEGRRVGTTMKAQIREALKSCWRGTMDLLPAKWHVAVDHLRFHGRLPDLRNPKTLNEKIAHRKLYERDPRMPALVDKIAVKETMAARYGAEFVIPTLATFASEQEIDFAALPYPCVVKANHGSSMNLFLFERPKDEDAARSQLRGYLHFDYYAVREEWAYSLVPRRLLVEPFIDGGEHGLVDYKFHTFSGRVYAIEVITDRYTTHTGGMFDSDWNEIDCQLGTPKAEFSIPRPKQLKAMTRHAEEIGAEFSYVRIDFYEIDGKMKFGELTFYPGGGVDVVTPPEYDAIFGAQWV